MKLSGILILASFSLNSFGAGFDELQPGGGYYSHFGSVPNKALKAGQCSISGTVYLNPDLQPIANVQIWQKKTVISISGAEGKFFAVVDTNEVIYFLTTDSAEVEIPAKSLWEKIDYKINIFIGFKRPTAVRKPVIYLYDDSSQCIDISVFPKGELTFTYPQTSDGWSVCTSEDGTLTDVAGGQEYPYLFWEGRHSGLFYETDQKSGSLSGFVVKRDTLVRYLDSILTKIGLNQTEKTDFITYWGPVLTRSEYALMQFVFNSGYEEKIASIQVNPAPDSMLRLFLLCSALDDANVGIQIKSQILPTFDRSGLCLVEWGGSEIELIPKQP